jgi:hypothetical protein
LKIAVRHRGLKDMQRFLDLSLEQFVHCLTGELRLLGILNRVHMLFLTATACSIMFWMSSGNSWSEPNTENWLVIEIVFIVLRKKSKFHTIEIWIVSDFYVRLIYIIFVAKIKSKRKRSVFSKGFLTLKLKTIRDVHFNYIVLKSSS